MIERKVARCAIDIWSLGGGYSCFRVDWLVVPDAPTSHSAAVRPSLVYHFTFNCGGLLSGGVSDLFQFSFQLKGAS